MKTEEEIRAMVAAAESELINMPDEKSNNRKKQIAHNNMRDHLRIQRGTLLWVLKTTPPKPAASGATTMEPAASSAVTLEKKDGQEKD